MTDTGRPFQEDKSAQTPGVSHPKTLGALFRLSGLSLPPGVNENLPISDFTDDSRAVKPGAVFIAVAGEAVDGHRFITQALEKGAACVLAEHLAFGISDPSRVIFLPGGTRNALAPLAHAWWDNPSREMLVIGVTGTNGKTTTAYLTEALLRSVGRRPALLGTVEYRFEDYHEEARNTTPGAPELARLMAEFRARGADSVAMEVSSHALAQGRVEAIQFSVALLTNVTQDHLDYHHTMEEYAMAKHLLFTKHCPEFAIFNLDDDVARGFAARSDSRRLTYSLEPDAGADIYPESLELQQDGIWMAVRLPDEERAVDLNSPLRGRFNASNLLAAAAIGKALGMDGRMIARGLADMHGAPGRFEAVRAGQPFSIYVDYAHTPDAVRRVLENVRAVTPGRVLAVLGCGGDRDPAKRPIMGALLGRLADYSIITNDNPRTEHPEAIAAAMEEGIRSTARPDNYQVCLDRREAIRRVILMAYAGDSVVIAGKGHETYQIIGDNKLHFDDRETAAEFCREFWPGGTQ